MDPETGGSYSLDGSKNRKSSFQKVQSVFCLGRDQRDRKSIASQIRGILISQMTLIIILK